jgi:hypothetical protein
MTIGAWRRRHGSVERPEWYSSRHIARVTRLMNAVEFNINIKIKIKTPVGLLFFFAFATWTSNKVCDR